MGLFVKERELRYGPTEQDIKENGVKIKLMARANSIMPMEISMRVNG
jgi:hypothetical protein